MNHNIEASKRFLSHNTYKAAGAGIIALGVFVTGNVIVNTFGSDPKFESDSHATAVLENKQNKQAALSSDLEKEKRPESLIAQALIDGPLSAEDVIGTYSVKQDESIGNAMINRAAEAGYIIDIVNDRNDLLAVDLSSNQFGSIYHKDDKFDLFMRDIDGDSEPEILAQRTESNE